MANEVYDLAVLRRIYGAIIQGYVTAVYLDKTVYIRHFSALEQAELDEEYLKFFEEAKEKGLPTEKEKLSLLRTQEMWDDQKDAEIAALNFQISHLFDVKRGAYLPSQIEETNKQIKELEEKHRQKIRLREVMVGLTCESFAFQKLNEIYIYKSFYKDKGLLTPLFTPEEFAELEPSEIGDLIYLYNTLIKDFCDKNLQRVALAPFFQSYFQLCDDNVYYLFGKPIVHLTFYQSELARAGKYFKAILSSETKPPKDVMDDPEKLIDWFMGATNAKKVLDKSKAAPSGKGDTERVEGSMSLVGAKASDLEALGLKPTDKANSIQAVAEKKNGSLSMEDFLNMSGIKMKK